MHTCCFSNQEEEAGRWGSRRPAWATSWEPVLWGGGTCVRLQRGTLLNGRSLIPANCPFLAVGICERVVRNSHVRSMNMCHVATDILYMCPQTQDAAVAR